jgi:hypothetical protein
VRRDCWHDKEQAKRWERDGRVPSALAILLPAQSFQFGAQALPCFLLMASINVFAVNADALAFYSAMGYTVF